VGTVAASDQVSLSSVSSTGPPQAAAVKAVKAMRRRRGASSYAG